MRATAPSFQGIPIFLYHGLPPAFPAWGTAGALRYLLPEVNVKVYPMEGRTAAQLIRQSPAIATLVWVQQSHKLGIAAHYPDSPDATYIMMNEVTPIWQLTNGWFGLEEGFRWAAPQATARLYRAPRATQFEVVLDTSPQLLATLGHTDFTVRLNGVPLGTARLTESGMRTLRWPLPPGPPGTVEAEFQTDPPFHERGSGTRTLGMPVVSFGFLPSGR